MRLLAFLLFTFTPAPGALAYDCAAVESFMWHPWPQEPVAVTYAVSCDAWVDAETGQGLGVSDCGDLPWQACGTCVYLPGMPWRCEDILYGRPVTYGR